MKRILVPVDFSPTSQKAFRYALDIASKAGGSVILYHLYTPGKAKTKGVFESVRAYNQQMEINSLKRLQRLKKKVLPESISVPVSTIVGEWDAWPDCIWRRFTITFRNHYYFLCYHYPQNKSELDLAIRRRYSRYPSRINPVV